MRRPPVTVVTPSFNQGQFIRATIESVLSQGYENLEYIVMDGGSTDATSAIVRDYASRLTFISEPDRGQSHAINKGFRMARGEYVAWLNSDDIFLPGAIGTAATELREHPNAGAVYGDGFLIDREGNRTGRFPFAEPFNLWKLVHLSDYVLQQTVFFRRSVFDRVGFLDEDLEFVMDWEILIRIGKRFDLRYVPVEMGCLREYPEAKSFAGGERRVEEIARMMRSHAGRKYPPGLVVYGLDTYRKLWCERMQARSPRLLKPASNAIRWLVNGACCRLIGHQILKSQGWSPDRWIGKRLNLMAPEGASHIVLSGFNPEQPSTPTQFDILVDGDQTAIVHVPSGDFRLTVELAPSRAPSNIRVIAKGFPAREPGPDGCTRYCRLDRVDCLYESAPLATEHAHAPLAMADTAESPIR